MGKSDPFLAALLASGNHSQQSKYVIPNLTSPVPAPSKAGTSFNFASYFNNKANGIPTSARDVGISSQGQQQEQSTLSKVGSWLGSLGLGVENIAYDTAHAVKTHESPSTLAKNLSTDTLAALAHVVQPVVDAGPIHVPWEKKFANYTFENNLKNHGKDYMTGSKLLNEIDPMLKGTPAAALGGFAVDTISDPMTYGGVSPAIKGAKGILKLAGVGSKVGEIAKGATEGEKATIALERGKQAAQEAGFAAPESTKPSLLNYVSTGKEADQAAQIKHIISDAPTGPIEGRLIPVANDVNKGLDKVLSAKGLAVTRSGKFIPLATQRVINDVARAGGTLPPVASPTSLATGPRAVQAVTTARDFVLKSGLKGKILKPKDQAKLFDWMYKGSSSDNDVLRMTANKVDTPEAKVIRHAASVQSIKTAEDTLQKLGYQFHDWNGSGLKISDVAAEIPKGSFATDMPKVVKAFSTSDFTKVTDPRVQEYVANALARRNLAVGTVSKDIYDRVAQTAAANEVALSPARYRDWLTGEAQRQFEAARPLGFTDKEANAFKDLFANHSTIEDIDLVDAYDLIDHTGPRLVKSFLDGKRDTQFINQMNKAIAKSMGIPYGRAGKILKPMLDVEDSYARRLTTWYGRGSMIHKARSEFTAANNWAKMRNGWIGNIRKGYSNEDVEKAWVATMRPIDDLVAGQLEPNIAELSQKFRDYFDNIIGPESPLGKRVAQSTVVDSQMIAADLNRHLKAVGSKFVIHPDKGGEWLDSIYNYKVLGKKAEGVDPTTFLYNFDLAIQRTLGEYNLVDDFAMRFGAKPGEAGFDRFYHTTEVAHGRTNGYKFDKVVARQFNTLLEDLRKGNWRPDNQATSMLTNGLRKWKGGVTIYYPAHHIRNLVGDTWLMWASGINDPRVFGKALRVIGSERNRYTAALKDPDLSHLQSMIEPGKTDWINTEGSAIISKRGAITANEYYHEALKRGILLDAQRIEDLQGEALSGGKSLTKPFGGQLHTTIAQISEYREHYVRLAHLVGYVEKNMPATVARKLAATEGPIERSKIMEDMFDKAAQEIRKWHPDGTDLTYWEQKYARNVMPFYSWTRKAVPLLLESMMLHPAKVLAYPRGMFAIQQALGINAPDPYQPFPEDQLYPDWLTAQGIGPIGNPQSDNPIARWWGVLGTNAMDAMGKETGYTIVNPGNGALPQSMIGQMFGMGTGTETRQGLLQQLNPFFTVPAQLTTGSQISGAPIYKHDNGPGVLSYLGGVMPQTAPIQRFTQIGKSGQQNREPGPNWEALLNALTGLGVTGSGKYTKSAEFDAKDRAKRNQ